MNSSFIWMKGGRVYKKTYDQLGTQIKTEYLEDGYVINYPRPLNHMVYHFSRRNGFTQGQGDFKSIMRNNIFNSYKDLPAFTRYSVYGTKDIEGWYEDGTLHRGGDKPAEIRYHGDGVRVHSLRWFKHGNLYREGGKPHWIKYDLNGDIIRQSRSEDIIMSDDQRNKA